jgi:phosphoglycerate-specific signal transduction histidine kinase
MASVVVALLYDLTAVRWELMVGVWMLTFGLASIGMFLYFVMSRYGQRLGDKLANTLVIEDRARAEFHKTIYLEIPDGDYLVRYPEVMRLADRDINGIRNLLDVKRITREHQAYMERIALRITEVLGITTEQEPYDFLAQLLRDYNFLTSR